VGANGLREIPERSLHVPVMAEEIVAGLSCRAGGTYVDCTVGYGGHAVRILEATAPDGLVIGIDQDADAIAAARERLTPYGDRARLVRGNFSDLRAHLQAAGIAAVDGAVLDLGVSSAQLSDAARGFSFLTDGPLDMRMDQRHDVTAAGLLARLSETDLADLIYRYGEERYSRRIARAIVRARAIGPIRTCRDLATLVERAVPSSYRHGRIHPATRTFQALRIAVNRELEVLPEALRSAADLLAEGGRLCVISFHSLEDRIVKHTFRALSSGLGSCFVTLTKKPLGPSEAECRRNPRARSAKLRIVERAARAEIRRGST
jgi:16S rRNA (cytosine1402-N4)-methyltransferase